MPSAPDSFTTWLKFCSSMRTQGLHGQGAGSAFDTAAPAAATKHFLERFYRNEQLTQLQRRKGFCITTAAQLRFWPFRETRHTDATTSILGMVRRLRRVVFAHWPEQHGGTECEVTVLEQQVICKAKANSLSADGVLSENEGKLPTKEGMLSLTYLPAGRVAHARRVDGRQVGVVETAAVQPMLHVTLRLVRRRLPLAHWNTAKSQNMTNPHRVNAATTLQMCSKWKISNFTSP